MVVMVMMSHVVGFQVALFVLTDLRLGLKDCMANAVLLQFLPDQVFDGLDVDCLCNDVHGCVIVVTVYAPHMDVMDILHTLDL